MAANVLRYHDRSPFKDSKSRQMAIIFTPNEYYATKLATLSPIALRVLLKMASDLNGEGYVLASLDELAEELQSPRTYVNKGLLELARFEIISKKRRSEYWINPAVFRPAVIEL
ncbi:hypothetical protein [Larkinella punicea]|uniref:Plasmid replication protein RepL domain-containing protein n=1 Tax=Larkinella punicea TaxID=2315727 RepID=A0A368JWD6_9BACT|nr:hypothetical protein [Larkinella punicea]RCR71266.1 hypothetical protein DUE52_03195 [Larkinella punicea]